MNCRISRTDADRSVGSLFRGNSEDQTARGEQTACGADTSAFAAHISPESGGRWTCLQAFTLQRRGTREEAASGAERAGFHSAASTVHLYLTGLEDAGFVLRRVPLVLKTVVDDNELLCGSWSMTLSPSITINRASTNSWAHSSKSAGMPGINLRRLS
jgi:hypothetical protein